ncbi:hypothetical protein QFC21_004412 [Naganishia friedmannii]|uniref:Uncharacterized protein n=1 Tax=Naganishia friedmannii TaxID=89922 RepID=A0ACC2VHX1_9TREE|nr:hypothetical protein QFC21_004412 [Naganishia friedmannii]
MPTPANSATERRDRALADSVSLVHPGTADHEILESSNTAIVQGIREKRWTATEVLNAFVKRALVAQGETNCLTEGRPSNIAIAFSATVAEAHARARSLDEHFAQTGTVVGSLHGLPVSIKDMIHIRSVHTTLGLTSHLSEPPHTSSAAIVAALEHLGAIVPYVKTNVPQLLLSFECNNAVFGRTKNPYNPAHTSGGSSGGEGALIAFRGSALGIGTDIGGSLRIPAGYCGIYSLKPSSVKGSTWPTEGIARLGEGFEGLVSVVGPMCASAEDLQMVWVEVGRVLSLEDWRRDGSETASDKDLAYTLHKERLENEFGIPDLPARKPIDYGSLRPLDLVSVRQSSRPIRIGVYHTDGFVHTTPACYRAMEETISALRTKYSDAQIQLVPLPKEDVRAVEAMEIFVGLTSAAKYRHLSHPHLSPDALEPTLHVPVYVSRLPAFLRALISFVLVYILRETDFAVLGRATGGKSAEEYFKWVQRRETFRREWRERVWQGYDLDAIIAPIQATPALPHGGAQKLSLMSISTAMYNVLDYPIACLPVTRVDAAKDSHFHPPTATEGYERESQVWSKWANDGELAKCSRLVKKEVYRVYDANKMQGLPVGLQVITPPGKEERAIGIMRMVDDALADVKVRGGQWVDSLTEEKKVGFGNW